MEDDVEEEEQADHGVEESGDIEFGVHRSRHNTSYYRRLSSAVTQRQIMTREALEAFSLSTVVFARNLMDIILRVYPFILFLGRIQQLTEVGQHLIRKLKQVVHQLNMLVQIVLCYSEFAFLYAEDLSIFRRRASM